MASHVSGRRPVTRWHLAGVAGRSVACEAPTSPQCSALPCVQITCRISRQPCWPLCISCYTLEGICDNLVLASFLYECEIKHNQIHNNCVEAEPLLYRAAVPRRDVIYWWVLGIVGDRVCIYWLGYGPRDYFTMVGRKVGGSHGSYLVVIPNLCAARVHTSLKLWSSARSRRRLEKEARLRWQQ